MSHQSAFKGAIFRFCGLLLAGATAWVPAAADSYTLVSPDESIQMSIEVSDAVYYSVSVDDNEVLRPSRLAMTLKDGTQLGARPVFLRQQSRSVDQVLSPVVPVKSSKINDRFNETVFSFEGDYRVVFRAYNNGVAYRFETAFSQPIKVTEELVEYDFPAETQVYFPKEDSFQSHNERTYLFKQMHDLEEGELASLPALVSTAGIKVLISETDLRDYAGLWLEGAGEGRLVGVQPRFALSTEMKEGSDRNEIVTERADYVADTSGARTFPWRFLAIARTDADLLTNELSFQLASPLAIKDTSWIKPGKVAWDWWNANNIYGVDFHAGINTETYKYYIDFAADYGLEYIIMDEGWYRLGNLLDVVPEIDMEEIVAYGRQKGVDIILWVVWKTLDDQLEEAMDQFERWGVAGLKIDFMQRDDQWMVNYYWRMAAAAAERNLLVNFHGAYKPAGIRRAYPNVLTREGVKGLEHNKWAETITPEHNLTIPFIRMVAGPMDYTPGAMRNANPENFSVVWDRPMSMNTRAHQMALFVVYESPMQMLADTPSNYRREHESTAFIASVPAVWDETRVISAGIGEHLVMARRSGERWFLAGMTNSEARDVNVDLSFLGRGAFDMVSFEDGPNAARHAEDYKRRSNVVSGADQVMIKMSSGGGYVARFDPR